MREGERRSEAREIAGGSGNATEAEDGVWRLNGGGEGHKVDEASAMVGLAILVRGETMADDVSLERRPTRAEGEW